MGERAAAGFEQRAAGIQFSNRIPRLMRTIPKTIIAMVNGVAVGAGLSMALACDLRIAARSSSFRNRLPEDWSVRGLGWHTLDWLMTRLVGTAKARELYLLGDMISADEALTHGMVNRVADDVELLSTTMAIARRIADLPQIAVGYAKRNLQCRRRQEISRLFWIWKHSSRRVARRPRIIARRSRRLPRSANPSSTVADQESGQVRRLNRHRASSG